MIPFTPFAEKIVTEMTAAGWMLTLKATAEGREWVFKALVKNPRTAMFIRWGSDADLFKAADKAKADLKPDDVILK